MLGYINLRLKSNNNLILLIENNTTIAISASAAAIGNIGPAFGTIGPMDSFNSLNHWLNSAKENKDLLKLSKLKFCFYGFRQQKNAVSITIQL